MLNVRPALSVVIVSWNTKKLVLDCLRSLDRNVPMEIILVDNASSDGTVELVHEQFAHVRLAQNSTNLGFARANNIGIALSVGEYVCLINSDVEVLEGCLEKMLEFMYQHADVGMLGPKEILADGSVGQSCMRFPTLWNWFCRALALDCLFKGSRLFGDFLMTGFRYDSTADVEVLKGWFWMVRREALDQVGLLDDRFFMYGEDIDWSKRFHQLGWRVVFYPEAKAIHHCAASSSKAPIRFYIEMNRATLQYFERHHGRPAVIGFWLATLLLQVVRITAYSLLCPFKRRDRAEVRLKIKKSLICLLWLMGLTRSVRWSEF